MEGTIHIYHPKRRLPLFQYGPSNSSSATTPPTVKHVLLFIGGMYDNFGNTSYVNDLAAVLSPPWCLIHAQLSSAIRQFGFADLHKDIADISTALSYIRTTLFSSDTSVVLMGHSTGCQDVLFYLTSPDPPIASRPKVQGAILQAPVSDRDLLQHTISTDPTSKKTYDSCLSLISNTNSSDHTKRFLPLDWTTPFYGPAPITMSRFLSLASPSSPENPGPDDMFSHDLPDSALQSTFGRIGEAGVLQPPTISHPSSTNNDEPNKSSKPRMLLLLSGSDESYPPPFHHSNAITTLGTRFKLAIEHSGTAIADGASSVLQGAKHDLSGDSLPERRGRLVKMRKAVLGYVERVVGDVGKESWERIRKDEEEIEGEERRKGEEVARRAMESLKL